MQTGGNITTGSDVNNGYAYWKGDEDLSVIHLN